MLQRAIQRAKVSFSPRVAQPESSFFFTPLQNRVIASHTLAAAQKKSARQPRNNPFLMIQHGHAGAAVPGGRDRSGRWGNSSGSNSDPRCCALSAASLMLIIPSFPVPLPVLVSHRCPTSGECRQQLSALQRRPRSVCCFGRFHLQLCGPAALCLATTICRQEEQEEQGAPSAATC